MVLLDVQQHYNKTYRASTCQTVARKEKRIKNKKPQKCTGMYKYRITIAGLRNKFKHDQSQ